MSEQWEIGSEVSEAEYSQCALYCNAQKDRHIEKTGNQYFVVANRSISQELLTTTGYSNSESTGGGGNNMQYLLGDGSDGNVTLENDTSYDEMKNFLNFTINSGVTLGKTTAGSPLILRCQETCTINGAISLKGKGFSGSTGDGIAAGYGKVGSDYSLLPGISLSSRSASGSCDKNLVQMFASVFDFASIPWCGGGGAGSSQTRTYGYINSSWGVSHSESYGTPGIGAGSGGVSSTWYSTGKDNTNGTATSVGGSGGGGLLIIAKRIVLSGGIDVSGNNGNAPATGTYAAYGGGGGGGTVVLLAKESLEITGTVNYSGGAGGGGSAGAGGAGCMVQLVIP